MILEILNSKTYKYVKLTVDSLIGIVSFITFLHSGTYVGLFFTVFGLLLGLVDVLTLHMSSSYMGKK